MEVFSLAQLKPRSTGDVRRDPIRRSSSVSGKQSSSGSSEPGDEAAGGDKIPKCRSSHKISGDVDSAFSGTLGYFISVPTRPYKNRRYLSWDSDSELSSNSASDSEVASEYDDEGEFQDCQPLSDPDWDQFWSQIKVETASEIGSNAENVFHGVFQDVPPDTQQNVEIVRSRPSNSEVEMVQAIDWMKDMPWNFIKWGLNNFLNKYSFGQARNHPSSEVEPDNAPKPTYNFSATILNIGKVVVCIFFTWILLASFISELPMPVEEVQTTTRVFSYWNPSTWI